MYGDNHASTSNINTGNGAASASSPTRPRARVDFPAPPGASISSTRTPINSAPPDKKPSMSQVRAKEVSKNTFEILDTDEEASQNESQEGRASRNGSGTEASLPDLPSSVPSRRTLAETMAPKTFKEEWISKQRLGKQRASESDEHTSAGSQTPQLEAAYPSTSTPKRAIGQIIDLTLDDDSPNDVRAFRSQALLNERDVKDEPEMPLFSQDSRKRRAKPRASIRTEEEILQRDRRIREVLSPAKKPKLELSAQGLPAADLRKSPSEHSGLSASPTHDYGAVDSNMDIADCRDHGDGMQPTTSPKPTHTSTSNPINAYIAGHPIEVQRTEVFIPLPPAVSSPNVPVLTTLPTIHSAEAYINGNEEDVTYDIPVELPTFKGISTSHTSGNEGDSEGEDSEIDELAEDSQPQRQPALHGNKVALGESPKKQPPLLHNTPRPLAAIAADLIKGNPASLATFIPLSPASHTFPQASGEELQSPSIPYTSPRRILQPLNRSAVPASRAVTNQSSFVADSIPDGNQDFLSDVIDEQLEPGETVMPAFDPTSHDSERGTPDPLQKPTPPANHTRYSSSDVESDADVTMLDLDAPGLVFSDGENAQNPRPDPLLAKQPTIHVDLTKPGWRPKQRKAERNQPRPFGYKHRGAIVWTGQELEDEFNWKLLNRYLDRKHESSSDNDRQVFRSHINYQIAMEEPRAPTIDIIDPINDPIAQAKGRTPSTCPPIEYYYTNRVIYRKGVPLPLETVNCNCEDVCGIDCPCLKKQQDILRELREKGDPEFPYQFAYGEDGALQLPHPFPVWECNSHCKCSRECRNRKVGNGRTVKLDIVNTKTKGWGIQAAEHVPKGSFLCLYAGEMLTTDFAEDRGKVDDLDQPPRSYLFDIDSEWLKKFGFDEDGIMVLANNKPAPQEARVNYIAANTQVIEKREPSEDQVEALYAVDARHYGNLARYFNHSCDPNAVLRSVFVDDQDTWKPLLCIFSRRAISAGEEVTISYAGLSNEDVNRERWVPSSPETMEEPIVPIIPYGVDRKVRKGKNVSRGKNQQAGTARVVKVQNEHKVGNKSIRCRCGAGNCDGNMWN